MFHDLGASPSQNGPQRFEFSGADTALAFILSHPLQDILSHSLLHEIRVAISLHTSPGIAERVDSFTHLLRVAVISNFSSKLPESLGRTEHAAGLEQHLPRLDIEGFLPRAIVSQATRGGLQKGLYEQDGVWTDSVKFPKNTWPGVLLRGHLERVRDRGDGWDGLNPAF